MGKGIFRTRTRLVQPHWPAHLEFARGHPRRQRPHTSRRFDEFPWEVQGRLVQQVFVTTGLPPVWFFGQHCQFWGSHPAMKLQRPDVLGRPWGPLVIADNHTPYHRHQGRTFSEFVPFTRSTADV